MAGSDKGSDKEGEGDGSEAEVYVPVKHKPVRLSIVPKKFYGLLRK